MCISVLVLYQHDDFVWRFFYIRNVLPFPTHLMCTRHSISERLSTYSWFQPGSVKFILLCKYSCIPLISIVEKTVINFHFYLFIFYIMMTNILDSSLKLLVITVGN